MLSALHITCALTWRTLQPTRNSRKHSFISLRSILGSSMCTEPVHRTYGSKSCPKDVAPTDAMKPLLSLRLLALIRVSHMTTSNTRNGFPSQYCAQSALLKFASTTPALPLSQLSGTILWFLHVNLSNENEPFGRHSRLVCLPWVRSITSVKILISMVGLLPEHYTCTPSDFHWQNSGVDETHQSLEVISQITTTQRVGNINIWWRKLIGSVDAAGTLREHLQYQSLMGILRELPRH